MFWMGTQHVGVSQCQLGKRKRGRVSCREPQGGKILHLVQTFGTGCTGLKHGIVAAGGAEWCQLNFVVS